LDGPAFRAPTLRELEGVSSQWRPYIGDILWDADTIATKVRHMGEQVSAGIVHFYAPWPNSQPLTMNV
jgi:hypothetical protein